jgi:hypothetical protein
MIVYLILGFIGVPVDILGLTRVSLRFSHGSERISAIVWLAEWITEYVLRIV